MGNFLGNWIKLCKLTPAIWCCLVSLSHRCQQDFLLSLWHSARAGTVSTMAAQLYNQLSWSILKCLSSATFFLPPMIFFLASCTNNIFSVVSLVANCFHFNKRNFVTTEFIQNCCYAYFLLYPRMNRIKNIWTVLEIAQLEF